MGTIKDLKGQRFNRLLVVEFSGMKNNRRALWKCLCDCGRETTVLGVQLRIKAIQSCGCYSKDRFKAMIKRHGEWYSSEYKAWSNMLTRCYNKKSKDYKDYGGRGITVCDDWKNSFESFINYIGKNPQREFTLDRINVDGNYDYGNARWVSKKIQSINKRKRIGVSSKYRGVYFNKEKSNWRAILTVPKRKHLGYFNSELEAAMAYNNEVKSLNNSELKLNIFED